MTWWTAGGASGAVAVYQPIGAASLAASYTDLSGSGNDAAPGSAPSFDAATGWGFTTFSQYLTTGVVPGAGYSYAMRVNMTSGPIFGRWAFGVIEGSGLDVGFLPNRSNLVRWWRNGGNLQTGASIVTGEVVAIIAGQTAYLDGVAETGTIPSPSGTASGDVFINGYNTGSSQAPGLSSANVAAFAIWNNTLSSDEVAAVTAAMAALPDAGTSPVPIIMQVHAAAGWR